MPFLSRVASVILLAVTKISQKRKQIGMTRFDPSAQTGVVTF